MFQNTIQTKSLPIAGGITTYKGGGYVVTLGRTRDKSLALIDELKVSFFCETKNTLGKKLFKYI